MLPESIANQTVTRLRGSAAADTHWNEDLDWTTPDEAVITGCSVQGQLGSESLGDRDSVVWQFTLYLPPDADVVAYDRIRSNGIDYEVDGPVVPMPDPTGAGLDHKMAKLALVEG